MQYAQPSTSYLCCLSFYLLQTRVCICILKYAHTENGQACYVIIETIGREQEWEVVKKLIIAFFKYMYMQIVPWEMLLT